jgi:hypothetical protein
MVSPIANGIAITVPNAFFKKCFMFLLPDFYSYRS